MAKAAKSKEVEAKPVKKVAKEVKKTAKITKPIRSARATKATKLVKEAKVTKKPAGKDVVVKSKKTGLRRQLNNAKIAQLQKMYSSKKHSLKSLCEEFGISMATLFNYLKIKI
jgi:hypothetical protein